MDTVYIFVGLLFLFNFIAYITHRQRDKEHFNCMGSKVVKLNNWTQNSHLWNVPKNPEDYQLRPDGSFNVSQGASLPVMGNVVLLNNEDAPSVNGLSNAPKSLNVFAYNKVSPKCCYGPNGGYSTSGGCVCVTPEQEKWFAEVGGNRQRGYIGID
jgi:hypothetical protein